MTVHSIDDSLTLCGLFNSADTELLPPGKQLTNI